MSYAWRVTFTVVNNSGSELHYENSSPGVMHHDDPPTIPIGSTKSFIVSILGSDHGDHYIRYSHSGESVKLHFQSGRGTSSPITANDPEDDRRVTSSSHSGPGVYDRSVEYIIADGLHRS
ncbi:hypothetical protein TWF481_006092 [Arthrobotrys musiformis]|uniref:Uncharacterized protein n=1 Tax=Arthrobotrys musiformis TaxID=47236 RepID=A0AAV9WHP5_9PEZI